MKKFLLVALLFGAWGHAQKFPINYDFGETFKDRFRYSNLMTISEDGAGGFTLVRAYYQGLILKPRGYVIERYDAQLNLIEEYNYKEDQMQFVDGYIKNGILTLIFFNYDYEKGEYEYWAHQSAVLNFDFRRKKLVSIESEVVEEAFGKNYYNRDFSKGFTTILLFNEDKTGFLISTHYKKRKENQHLLHLFDTDLNKRWEYDFSTSVEEKNYAFEQLALSNNGQEAYLIAKAYIKKKRFEPNERKFAYELVKVSPNGVKTQTFDEAGIFPEGLYPIITNNDLYCVGFYADRKDNRYNGLAYYRLDPNSLDLEKTTYSPFSTEFMYDKFGREDDKEIRNLVFKSVALTADKELIFNAEEYFVTESMQSTGAGQRLRMERFHYNDIVCAKLDAQGTMQWARNINKSEVTQNDGAYVSYSSYIKDGKSYFFISSAAENPQLINNERLIFKQGFSRNRNIFSIMLDENGKMDYEKIIDSKEAKLPLMVSRPLINKAEDQMLFYAKRGSRKQLVEVTFKEVSEKGKNP